MRREIDGVLIDARWTYENGVASRIIAYPVRGNDVQLIGRRNSGAGIDVESQRREIQGGEIMTDEEADALYLDVRRALASTAPDFDLVAEDLYNVGETDHAIVFAFVQAKDFNVPIPHELIERALPIIDNDRDAERFRRSGSSAAA